MARSVADVALLMSVQAGPDPRAPFAHPDAGATFAQHLDRDWKGMRIGWLGDLGGALPMEPGVLDTCENALSAFRTIGMEVPGVVVRHYRMDALVEVVDAVGARPLRADDA